MSPRDTRGSRLVVVVNRDHVLANVGYMTEGETSYELVDFSRMASRTADPEEVASSLAQMRARLDLEPDGLVVVAERPGQGEAAPEVQAIDSLDIGLPIMRASVFDSEIRVLPEFVLADDAYLGKRSGVPSSLNLPWSVDLCNAEFCLYVGLTRTSCHAAWVSLQQLDVRLLPDDIGLRHPGAPPSEEWAWQVWEACLGLLADPPGSVRAVLLGGWTAGIGGESVVSRHPARSERWLMTGHGVLSGYDPACVQRWMDMPMRPLPEHAAMLGGLELSLT